MIPTPAAARTVAHPAPGRTSADTLLDALTSETRLLDELVTVMRRQREAVAADDLQGLDDTVFATHRVLMTLAEARRRRRSVNRLLGQPEELGVHEIGDALGARATPALRAACDALQASARVLSREVEVNRQVLREAMAAGNEYVRSMLTPPGDARLYSDAAGERRPDGGGLLINRRA